jgi:hypothetical protein
LLVGPAEAEGVARLVELWPNLRAGFDWACANGDGELADALVRPVVGEVNLRQQTEVSDWAERILTLMDPAKIDDAAFWLVCLTYRCKQAEHATGTRNSSIATATPTIHSSGSPAPTSTTTAPNSPIALHVQWPGFAATAKTTPPTSWKPAAWQRV